MQFGKKFKLGLLPTFLCLVGILLAACGGSGGNNTTTTKPTKAPASKQTFRIGINNIDFPTLDPGQTSDQVSSWGINLLFTGLVKLDDQLKIQPQLAQSYSTSSDGLTYTFHLRSNLKFSDGTPLTSQDVIYSIDRALSPQIANLNGVSLTYLGLIKDSEGRVGGKVKNLINDSLMAPDQNTVVIKLNKSTGYFLQALTYPTSWVVEKSVIDKWGLKWTNHLMDNGGQGGDGPFKMQTYNHSTDATFIPNTNYEQTKPQLQKIDVVFFKDTKTTYQAYQANQVDSAGIPIGNYLQLKQNSKEFHETPTLAIRYIAMNYLAKPFNNIKIRQALELAINKDVIAKDVFKQSVVPTCHIVPQGMPGYNSGLKCPMGSPTSGNETLAKQLFTQGLQEEGLTVATFPNITLTSYADAPTYDNALTTIFQMWKRVLGVTTIHESTLQFAQLIQAETNTLGKSPQQGGLQMWLAGWIADYPDPQDWLSLQFGQGSPSNQFNYGINAEQKQVQQQMSAADAMQNGPARYQAYNTIEQQSVNDVAWAPLYQEAGAAFAAGATVRKSYVYGLVDNALSSVQDPNDWGNVYIATH